MKPLSVCIPTYSEEFACVETVKSIRATSSASDTEIVVVCDGGRDADHPKFDSSLDVVVHYNSERAGSGPSRHIAASIATGKRILITDCHCVFPPGWFETLAKHFHLTTTLHCGSMIALDSNHPTIEHNNGTYFGARFAFDGGKVLEAVWAEDLTVDDYEIQAVMGACYAIDREYYLKLSPHRYFRSFGNEEESLSLKVWLSGGNIKLLRDFHIGHRFRSAKERVPYEIQKSHLLYNRMFTILACLPKEYQDKFLLKFPQNSDMRMAASLIKNDAHLIEVEREYNRKIFTRDFNWLVTRFGLQC